MFEDGITRNRKVEVVIQSSQVPGDLTDYEWTVTEDNLPSEIFDGANQAQNGGGDIRFSSDSAGNNQLAIDVVTFITDPTEGEAEINVLVPSVSGSVDTSIWVWYNTGTTASQPSPSHQFGSDNAYRSTAELVLTLNEDPAGTAPQFIDRTANGNDGTANGGITSGDSVPGKIGNAVDFDGTDDLIDLNAVVEPAAEFSVECWAQIENLTNIQTIAGGREAAGGDGWAFRVRNDLSGKPIQLAFFGVAGVLSDGEPLTAGQWAHLHTTWDGSTARFVVDGQAWGSGSLASNNSTSFETWIGSLNDGGISNFPWSGLLDGVRIHTEDLSLDYKRTRHNNTDSPGTFAVAGTPEDTGGDTAVSGDVSAESAQTSGAAGVTVSATGDAAAENATAAGEANATVTASGGVASEDAQTSGAVSSIAQIAGGVEAQPAQVAGDLSVTVAATGDVAAQDATADGDTGVTVAASGGVTAGESSTSGDVSTTDAAQVTGDVSAEAAQTAGDVSVTVAATGDSAAETATADGVAGVTVTVTVSGGVASPDAQTSGDLSTVAAQVTGGVEAEPSETSGVVAVGLAAAGAVSAESATVAGDLATTVTITGDVAAAAATAAGSVSTSVVVAATEFPALAGTDPRFVALAGADTRAEVIHG